MKLDIEGVHFAASEDQCQWTLTSTTGQLRSTQRRRPPPQLDFASLRDLGYWLRTNGIIPAEAVQSQDAIEQQADELAKAFPQALSFGGGRFVVGRDRLGNLHLRNPAQDVRCLRDRLGGQRDFVGFCGSMSHALSLAAIRSFMAEERTIPYVTAEAELLSAAEKLWADLAEE